ncbi:MAG: hypothetical protein AAGC61_08165 [Microbacterium sp.]
MNAVEVKANPGAVRAWARKNGIAVSKTGTIARHVWECYVEANTASSAAESVELQARNSRPDLFALADDMVEAEMIRAGRLSFDGPDASASPAPVTGESRSLSDWLKLRDELAAAIAEHPDPREAAEALLVRGWTMGAAA